jgi:hypothetical protein
MNSINKGILNNLAKLTLKVFFYLIKSQIDNFIILSQKENSEHQINQV